MINSFKIFNRFGQAIFEKGHFQIDDPSSGWNGKYKGKDQPMDAYAYTLDALMFGGTSIKKSGSITLIR